MTKFYRKILIFSLAISLHFFFACTTRIVEEKDPKFAVSSNKSPGEQDALDKLSGYQSTAEGNVSKLAKLRTKIENDQKALNVLYGKIQAMDFMDADRAISVPESKDYYDFNEELSKIEQSIKAERVDDLETEIKDLIKTAESEQKEFTDSLSFRQLLDQLKDQKKSFDDNLNNINSLKETVKNQKDSIATKIDNAAKNFNAHFGNKVVDLNDLIQKSRDAKSLKDINTILQDIRFFNLEHEVINEPTFGAAFTQALQKVRDEFQIVIAEARNNIATINSNLVGLTNQVDVDRAARELDRLLESPNQEFEKFAKAKGFTPVELQRQSALRELLRKQPTDPVSYKTPAELFSEVEADLRKAKVKNDILNAIKKLNFLSIDKQNALKNAVDDAMNPANYTGSYLKLLNSLEKFSFDSIEDILKEGNVIPSNNIEQFYLNAKKLSELINEKIYNDIIKAINTAIDNRVASLQNIIKNNPNIQNIINAFTTVHALKADTSLETKFPVVCNAFVAVVAPLLSYPINCANVTNELITDIGGSAAVKERSKALEVARGKLIKQGLQDSIDDLSSIRLGITGTENIRQGDEAVNRLVHTLNTFLQAAIRINTATFPPVPYTVNTLINDVLNTLNTRLIKTPLGNFTYVDLIEKLLDQLDPAMTNADISALNDKITKVIKDPLNSLDLFVGKIGMNTIIYQFKAPPLDELLKIASKDLKTAVDSTGAPAGTADYTKALNAVDASFDEASSRSAILNFASFFRDVPAIAIPVNPIPARPFHTQISNIVALAGVYPINLADQINILQNNVKATPQYTAVKFVADIDPLSQAAMDAVLIQSAPGSASLEEEASKLPAALRRAIFNKNKPLAFVNLGIVIAFGELKDRLIESLIALKTVAGTQTLLRDRKNIEPLVNAFNFIFAYPVAELNKLALDGSDDGQLQKISTILEAGYAVKYVPKFNKFKHVVGKDEFSPPSPPNTKRPIIAALEILEAKLVAATSLAPQIIALRNYVRSFLQ